MSGERKYVKYRYAATEGYRQVVSADHDYDYSSVPHDDGQGWVEVCKN